MVASGRTVCIAGMIGWDEHDAKSLDIARMDRDILGGNGISDESSALLVTW